MYRHVHIIANLSVIYKKFDPKAKLRARKSIVLLQSMYGNAITENVWVRNF